MLSVDDILELNLVSATLSSLVHQLAPQQVMTPNSERCAFWHLDSLAIKEIRESGAIVFVEEYSLAEASCDEAKFARAIGRDDIMVEW